MQASLLSLSPSLSFVFNQFGIENQKAELVEPPHKLSTAYRLCKQLCRKWQRILWGFFLFQKNKVNSVQTKWKKEGGMFVKIWRRMEKRLANGDWLSLDKGTVGGGRQMLWLSLSPCALQLTDGIQCWPLVVVSCLTHWWPFVYWHITKHWPLDDISSGT